MSGELAASLIRTIVEQRKVPSHSLDTFLESTTQQAKHILSFGLAISVRVLLEPEKCECQLKSDCKKAIEFEVWTIKVDKYTEENGLTILPIFLQQAVLSNLHFSSFNSWLSQNHGGKLPNGCRCVFKICTTSTKITKPTKVHTFPPCIVDSGNKECLKISVEWICKEEFQEIGKCQIELKKSIQKEPDPTILINDCIILTNVNEKKVLTDFTASSSSNYPRIMLEKKQRIRRFTTGSDLPSRREAYNGSPVPWSQSKTQKESAKSSQSGLLCNFEESVLKNRLHPINSLNGFKLQMIIQDRFNGSPVELPITTYFFNIEEAPNLSLGNCILNKPIRLSKNCKIQATIFNPRGYVLRIFIVQLNVNIPPNSKTFVRQKTYCVPKTLPIEEAKRSLLRYLIHFRLVTDRNGRLFMHSEIKMLFANKIDLDIQNMVAGQDEFNLITCTEEPSSGFSK